MRTFHEICASDLMSPVETFLAEASYGCDFVNSELILIFFADIE